jgi:hemerythrin-like domain-containing protein
MSVAEIAAALNTVEQDHQLVLDRVQALKEMVAALGEPGDFDPARVFGRLRELDTFFVTQFMNHLDEEEKTLFPLFERLPPEGPGLAERLRREHDELRRQVNAFDRCLSVALDLQDRPPRVMLRDLLTSSWEFWEVLDRHAHAESQGLRECLSQHLREPG